MLRFRGPAMRLLAGMSLLCVLLATGFVSASEPTATVPGLDLSAGFRSPPLSARPRVFWDWLNGSISREQITEDLKEMHRKGIGGAMIFQTQVEQCPDGAVIPQGVPFMSDAWRELFRHAVEEAARLGMEIGLMDSEGWNCGGPWVPPELCGRRLVWSETKVQGPGQFSEALPLPVPQVDDGRGLPFRPETVVDIAVLAIPERSANNAMKGWTLKSAYREVEQTTPDLLGWARSDKEVTNDAIPLKSVINLTEQLDAEGKLHWDVPEGDWVILRMAHALGGRPRLLTGPGPGGPMLDHLSAEAMDLHFQATVEKLAADVGLHTGKTFTFVECDSCDFGTVNWTGRFMEEFQRRRGYDMTPYLPALTGCIVENPDATERLLPEELQQRERFEKNHPLPVMTGRIVENPEATERFLFDFRQTISDCIADNHYGCFRELCRKRGLKFMSEAGGPPPGPINALRCLSRTEIPMGEFWAQEHTLNIRGAASAAHTNGVRLVAAEAFTSWEHWTQSPQDLKPFVDRAFCEGLNQCWIHGFSTSPPEAGKPGYVFYAGTHFEPNITWWEQSECLTDYLARCQFLLQQGLPVADVLCYYGEHAPNFMPPNREYWYELCPSLGDDYACDFADIETLLDRLKVEDGRLVLPDGMSYKLLVYPEAIAKGFPCHGELIRPELAQKLLELVSEGATVVWPRPSFSPGLRDYPRCDARVAEIVRELWGPDETPTGDRRIGRGRIIWGKTPREVLLGDGVLPDFSHQPMPEVPSQRLAYCHRRVGDVEIYFVANRDRTRAIDAVARFRVTGKAPELWHPDSGMLQPQIVYSDDGERTWMPLRLPPAGSAFVVFRLPAENERIVQVVRNGETLFSSNEDAPIDLSCLEFVAGEQQPNAAIALKSGSYTFCNSAGKTLTKSVRTLPNPRNLSGPWQLEFPDREIMLDELRSWTAHDQPEIRYFSGTATYRTDISIPKGNVDKTLRVYLDLGTVKNLAEVRLNDQECGLLWKEPFRVDVTESLRPGKNLLEVKVTNLWPNRLIGDAFLPEEQRTTHTNMRVFGRNSALLDSGLLGPVRLHAAKRIDLDRFLDASTTRTEPPVTSHPQP